MHHVESKDPLGPDETERLLAFCLQAGVDCFTVTANYADAAERQRVEADLFAPIARFSLGRRSLEQTVVPAGEPWEQDVECWRFDRPAAAAVLALAGGGLASARVGGPEDWAFFRGGELFLGVVSHEGYVFLRLGDDDLLAFRGLRIPHRVA